jgi:hypothetical protein
MSEKETLTSYLIAAVVSMLPPKERYRFFSHFHHELKRHFSKGKPLELGRKSPPQGETLIWAECKYVLFFGLKGRKELHLEVRFPIHLHPDFPPAVWLKICWKIGKGEVKVQLQEPEKWVELLVPTVKTMSEAEQRLLWSLLDEALVDYEDYLLANDPKWVERLSRAREETGRTLDEVLSEIFEQSGRG